MKKLNRKFHHYEKWEDWKNGMYEIKPKSLRNIDDIVDLFKNEIKLKKSMRNVIKKWKISCEVNLSYRGYNRQAWLGQAAMCLELNSSEIETREAWSYLNQEEKDRANFIADLVIKEWECEQ